MDVHCPRHQGGIVIVSVHDGEDPRDRPQLRRRPPMSRSSAEYCNNNERVGVRVYTASGKAMHRIRIITGEIYQIIYIIIWTYNHMELFDA